MRESQWQSMIQANRRANSCGLPVSAIIANLTGDSPSSQPMMTTVSRLNNPQFDTVYKNTTDKTILLIATVYVDNINDAVEDSAIQLFTNSSGGEPLSTFDIGYGSPQSLSMTGTLVGVILPNEEYHFKCLGGAGDNEIEAVWLFS